MRRFEDRVVSPLLAGARIRPANAYLLVGSPDATGGLARRLAAALAGLSGEDEAAVLRGVHPDVVEFSPAGAASYLVEQGDDEIVPAAGRPPMTAPRKVVVLRAADVLGDVLSVTLLKTLEEPAPSVSFVLCALEQSVMPETIVSRCVTVAVPPLAPDETARRLSAESGADPARTVALVRETGSAARAATLLTDPGAAERHRRWLTFPSRLGREPLTGLVDEVAADVEEAAHHLAERHAGEQAVLDEFTGGRNVRGRKGLVKALEDRQRREARALTTAEQRAFLAALSVWYRDVLAVLAGCDPLAEDAAEAVRAAAPDIGFDAALAALDRISEAAEALVRNANADLAIEDALLDLRAITVG